MRLGWSPPGPRSVLDLGCGIGSDALAFRPRRSTGGRRRTRSGHRGDGRGQSCAGGPRGRRSARRRRAGGRGAAGQVDAVFCDPARRTGAGRTWRVEDFTPPWSAGLPAAGRPSPGRGQAGSRAAAPDDPARGRGGMGQRPPATRSRSVCGPVPGCARPSLCADHAEPDWSPTPPRLRPADRALSLRAGRGGDPSRRDRDLADDIGAGLIDPQIAYLTGDTTGLSASPPASWSPKRCPTRKKLLRSWVRDHEVGRLEIKCRGVDVDPAQLRRRFRPAGPARQP